MKFSYFLGGTAVVLFSLAAASTTFSAPAGDGLYATFQVSRSGSPVGEFTAKLEFETVPMTVANFVGLAEGTVAFIDFQNGHGVKRPFYNGITFHRVEPNFVIQAGSPNGLGTDGPGYTFPDEFDDTLRHSKAGILSMANSGPNSNGSQFFVTLAATPHLDDVHSVFGEIIEGMDVISLVQQDDLIDSITITRNGAAALAFDASSHGVPVVSDAEPTLLKTVSVAELSYSRAPNSEYFLFHTSDLNSWIHLDQREIYGEAAPQTTRDVSTLTEGVSKQFFTVAKTTYAGAIPAPNPITGKLIKLTDQDGPVLDIRFENVSTGDYTLTSGSTTINGDVNAYNWSPLAAYRGFMQARISGLSFGGRPIELVTADMKFITQTTGKFTGFLWNDLGLQAVTLVGTFELSDL